MANNDVKTTLTAAQVTIMHMVCRGLTYHEIAMLTHTTDEAIAMQMYRVRERLGVDSNVMAVLKMLVNIEP